MGGRGGGTCRDYGCDPRTGLCAPVEVAVCAIEHSVLIPMQQVQQSVETLPRRHSLIVVCHHGVRSAMVTDFLRNSGLDNAWNLAGGIDAWSRLIKPDMPRY
ncbi:MAG: sulfurtransferase [Nitrospira sp.]|nr:sulfurtransferase [Nitrospira sp.]